MLQRYIHLDIRCLFYNKIKCKSTLLNKYTIFVNKITRFVIPCFKKERPLSTFDSEKFLLKKLSHRKN